MASTSIRKTFSSNGNRNTWTLSFWVKRGALGSQERLFSCDDASSNNDDFFVFDNEDNLSLGFYSSGYYAQKETTRVFRDVNAWYHIVITWDTTNGTAEDRLRLYVNGVRETSFLSSTNPSSSANSFVNTTESWEIGKRSYNDTQYFSGSMSHVHFIDGTAYDASAFGETDANGVWKINTSPSVTYGTNGFWIFKDGNTITDSSPNSNDWSSVSGTLTNTEDNPSNVFCTLNALTGVGGDSGNKQVLSQGNLTVTGNQASWCHSRGTLGYSSGKWYWEAKVTGTISDMNIGVSNTGTNLTFGTAQSQSGNTTIYTDGSKNINGTITSGVFTAYSLGDIIGIAHNADANTVTFYKNGSAILSDQPVSGGSETTWTPASAVYNTTGFFSFNFGNGYFGTTAVSSAGTNASGIGIFEYDVPTGYTALSTKGLNL